MTKNTDPPRVKIVDSRYQPSKAELEEPIEFRHPDGTPLTPEEIAAIALRPVDIELTKQPD